MAGPGPGYHAILGVEAATYRLNNSREENCLLLDIFISKEKLILLNIKNGGKGSHVQVSCKIKSPSQVNGEEIN